MDDNSAFDCTEHDKESFFKVVIHAKNPSHDILDVVKSWIPQFILNVKNIQIT